MSQPSPSTVTRGADRGPQSTMCAAISALVRERWGRGPSRSRAYWAGPDTMLVLLDDAHTEAERTLKSHTRGADVLAGRRLLGELAEDDLRRIAEEATGRRVRAVLSQSSLEPPISTHVFVFESDARRSKEDEPLGDALQEALENSNTARALLAEGKQARRHSLQSRTESQSARAARRMQRGAPDDD
jgi:uncharacterized protein YbcI